MSMPARAPIATATSVQAAYATPRRSNRAGASGVPNFAAKNGAKNHQESTLRTPAAAATTTASGTSLPSVQRHRPKPCVQAYRNVPVSISLARIGAPTNAPSSAGVSVSSSPAVTSVGTYLVLNMPAAYPQVDEFAGWQVTMNAQAWCIPRPVRHRYTASP